MYPLRNNFQNSTIAYTLLRILRNSHCIWLFSLVRRWFLILAPNKAVLCDLFYCQYYWLLQIEDRKEYAYTSYTSDLVTHRNRKEKFPSDYTPLWKNGSILVCICKLFSGWKIKISPEIGSVVFNCLSTRQY